MDDDAQRIGIFHTYVLNTQEILKRAISFIQPESTIEYQITTGLLVKMLKLYKGIINNGSDELVAEILLRCLYDACLSVGYLTTKNNPELFKEFVETDAMRRRDLVRAYEKLSRMDKHFEPAASRLAEVMTQSIASDGLNIETLPVLRDSRPPRSWLKNISYDDMAIGFAAESKFKMIYQGASWSVHPSWQDIKRSHLEATKDDPKLLKPKLGNEGVKTAVIGMALCMTWDACLSHAKRYDNQHDTTYIPSLHNAFHKIFNPPSL
jgi:hypothetical protein